MAAFKGKVAVVTGASQGIGLACAEALLKKGSQVVVVARDEKKLRAVFKNYGKAAIPMAADLTKQADRVNLVARILDRTKVIDTFVANAGAYVGGDFVNNKVEDIETALTLDVNGVIVPAHATLNHMIKRKTGDLVVIDSIAGTRYPNYEPVYGPAKTAANRFAQLVRTQVAGNRVRVSSISPGPTLTPLVDGWDPARLAKAKAEGQFMKPTDVSNALVYMLKQPRALTVSHIEVTPTAFSLI